MRPPGPASLPDWITVTVRWVFILAVVVWMILAGSRDFFLLGIIALFVAGNLADTFLILTHQVTIPIRIAYLLADLVFAQLVFALASTGFELVWIGLLPLFAGALYFDWIGALACAIINALAQGVIYMIGRTPVEGGLLMAGVLFANLFAGLLLVYLNRRWMSGNTRIPLGGQPSEAQKRDNDRRHTIFDLISVLSASLNYQRVLETSLELSAQALEELSTPEVERLVSAVLLFNDGDRRSPELQVAVSRNMLPGDRDLRLPGASGLLAHVIDEGEACISRTVSSDAELGGVASLSLCRSVCCLPLRTGLDTYGLLLFAHPNPDFFTPDRREILDIVARQVVIAIQNARLYQDLEQEKNRITEIQEEGRKKLARDLHDGPTQSISAIAMRVNFARRLMDRDQKAAAEELYKIEELARRTTKEIRHMLFTLRPLVLESHGLVAALDSMAEKVNETFGQNVINQADPRAAEELEANKQAVIFYLAEEAVNNARKHAKAEHIWVRLKLLREELILLEVEDDGVGFDTHAVDANYENRGSLGMINLRERTELVNGVLRIDSNVGRGTRVQVVIPLTEAAADRIHRIA